jgi:hypothetical protein
MNDAHRRKMDKLDREKVFIAENVSDFPKDSPVERISAAINAKMNETLEKDAQLVSSHGDKTQARSLKENARDALIDHLRGVITGAIGIGNSKVPGITAKFKMPEPRTEQNLIAGADAFFADTAAFEADFIEAGLDADFRARIVAARDAFQQARNNADGALEEHGEAVGALEALFREMTELSRQRAAMVKLKYKNNPGKLAAWTIASRLEQAPKRPAVSPA